jgi:hypothetical protein
MSVAGKYSYKTYREGRGGFVNSLEISTAAGGNFIGVYAGWTSAEAEEFLVYVRTLYQQAALKRMTAGYWIIDQ